MSRIIKFRAWDKKRKRMYKVLHLHLASFEGSWATVEGFDVIAQSEVNIQIQPKDVELMQFTGLRDKTGKEIYEGDIVKHISGWNEYVSEVFWDESSYMFKYKMPGGSDPIYYWMHPEKTEHEIIGNIYENPELLSPKKSEEG